MIMHFFITTLLLEKDTKLLSLSSQEDHLQMYFIPSSIIFQDLSFFLLELLNSEQMINFSLFFFLSFL